MYQSSTVGIGFYVSGIKLNFNAPQQKVIPTPAQSPPGGATCGRPAIGQPQHFDPSPAKGDRQVAPPGRGELWLSMSGFTLVELVVVIVIIGILSALGGKLIMRPVSNYVDLNRRARLVDQAEMAMRRMQRDIRQALPNSIRIDSSGHYLELVSTVAGGRYRNYPDPVTGGDVLNFTQADDGFDVMGSLSSVPTVGQRLVVYNISPMGSSGNVYATTPDNIAQVGSGSTVDHVALSPAFKFIHPSPYQRFFVVEQPVTYGCEGGLLNRYSGYALSQIQPTSSLSHPALVASKIDHCRFSYDPGASQRAGLVTLDLSLTEEGETITLLHQVHVVNAP